MKTITTLALAFSAAALLPACTTVKVDPRSSQSSQRQSLYLNTDGTGSARPSGQTGGLSRRNRVRVEEPQPTPIRVKPGPQPVQYLNTTGSAYDQPTRTGASPYDATRGDTASPLRHDKPDQPLYSR